VKLHVVYDKKGDIVAAARLDEATSTDRPALRVRPVAKEDEGQRAVDVYVPPEFAHMDLSAVCERLRVDVAAKHPTLKPKD
jgi:hypothetical protein